MSLEGERTRGGGRGRGLRNAMHVWEVGLKLMMSTRSLVANHHKESSGGAAVTAGMGRTKVFFPPRKTGRRGKAFVKDHMPEEPRLSIRTCELRPSI